MMYKTLSDYVKISDIVYHPQHGFQQGHSTYMALINMQNRITKAIDNNEYSVGVLFDLAKAFDAVNHKILLEKLEHYGVRGIGPYSLNGFLITFTGKLKRFFVMVRGPTLTG